MTHRLLTVMEHLDVAAVSRTPELSALKGRLLLDSLRAQFVQSKERLSEMATYMVHEMHQGLHPKQTSTLRMLPSYVFKSDAAAACGVYYALDLGGTNFRVIRMLIRDGNLITSAAQPFAIPKAEMNGNAEGLFNFIANSILKFMEWKGFQEDNKAVDGRMVPLGFTFSFPVKQDGIASGTLIEWTKGFTTSGVVGKNVVGLLQDAFRRKLVNMHVVALCNDTVGTLITRYFADSTAELGVILGTGSNACYWERADHILKDPSIAAQKHREMVVNMEFGNFDSAHLLVLPRTSFDDAIDAESNNKGAQRFEKMISGMYLGEIVRRILILLANKGALPKAVAQKLNKMYGLESKDTGACCSDRTAGLLRVHHIFSAVYSIDLALEHDRHVVREVCRLVVHRAAQLSGMAVAAVLLKTSKQDNASVAVDGSVFEKTPGFRAVMQKTIQQLTGRGSSDVRLQLTRDGSGFGAGYIAALTEAASKVHKQA